MVFDVSQTVCSEGDAPMSEIPELSIPTEKICSIISMARRFDAKDAVADPDSGSNATDDGMRDVLEDHADDPVRVEFVTFVHDLNVDEIGRSRHSRVAWPR